VTEAAEGSNHSRESEFEALWDTGATKSVITQAVVDACGLAPTGRVEVSSVGGLSESETYLVNFVLPNQIRVRNVRVAKGALVGTNVLIGMDVIGLGDFTVTNLGGVTKFSFRVPSLVHIDFVEEANRGG
jgi:predicted aspartyl protease